MHKIKKESCYVQDKSTLVKRARAKYLSTNLAIQLKKENPTSELFKSYTNTCYCSSILVQEGKTLKSKYCKNRWCAVCNRIRTGKAIRGYLYEIKAMRDPYFVTLTKETVFENDLPASIKKMNNVFSIILDSRENRRRKIRGLRKSECTTRPDLKYHYHFHLIVEGKENAIWLVGEWLRLMGELSNPQAQDLRPTNERSQKEMFKYFAKLTIQNKANGERQLMDFKRMDVIFRAMRGKRVYQSFGGVKMASEEIEDIEKQDFEFLEECERLWKWSVNDWINELGECLSGYQPSEGFTNFLKNL